MSAEPDFIKVVRMLRSERDLGFQEAKDQAIVMFEKRGWSHPFQPCAAQPVGTAKDGLEEMSIEELDGELRSHGLDPAELDRNMLARLDARLKEYEAGGETPPERFLEMLKQFRVAVGTAKPESEKEGGL